MTRPKKDEIYRHFKGRTYRILAIAENTESGIEEVIYEALYEPYRIYARDLDMFVSKVDKAKYPNEKQEYRFELVENLAEINTNNVENKSLDDAYEDKNVAKKSDDELQKNNENSRSESVSEINDTGAENTNGIKADDSISFEKNVTTKENIEKEVTEKTEIEKIKSVEKVTEEKTTEKENTIGEKCEEVNPLIRFLNCDDYDSMIECLNDIREQLDEKMLTNMEFSLGMNEQKGSIIDRYLGIKKFIMLKQKYEKNSL